MLMVLTALAAVSFAIAVLVLMNSQSAVHEIEALILVVIGSIFIAARAVVGALEKPKETRAVRSSIIG